MYGGEGVIGCSFFFFLSVPYWEQKPECPDNL